MGYPTKEQLIRRQASQQWYVNFAASMIFVQNCAISSPQLSDGSVVMVFSYQRRCYWQAG